MWIGKLETEFPLGTDIGTDVGTAILITRPENGMAHCLSAAHNFSVRIREEDDNTGYIKKSFRQFDAISARFYPRLAKDKPVYECPVIMRSVKIHHKYYASSASALFLPENDLVVFAVEWEYEQPQWHDIKMNYHTMFEDILIRLTGYAEYGDSYRAIGMFGTVDHVKLSPGSQGQSAGLLIYKNIATTPPQSGCQIEAFNAPNYLKVAGRKTEALSKEEKGVVRKAKNVGIVGIHLHTSEKNKQSSACLITKDKYDFVNEMINQNLTIL